MTVQPAYHITIFGIYPNREIPLALRESFTAAGSIASLEQIVRDNAAQEFERERRADAASMESEAMGVQSAAETLQTVSHLQRTARMRMNSAVAIAARDGWIKPLTSTVIVGRPVTPSMFTVREMLLTGARERFNALSENQASGSLWISNEAIAAKDAIARIAHIRCIVDGQAVAFTDEDKSVLFKSVDAPFIEPELNERDFIIGKLDTIAHCAASPALARGPEMGFAAPKPEAP